MLLQEENETKLSFLGPARVIPPVPIFVNITGSGSTIIKASAFHLRDPSLLRAHDTHVKRSNSILYRKSWVSSGTPVPSGSHRECWQDGLGIAPNWSSHASCAAWSDISHNVAAMRGALRKPSTRSGWAPSFAIQLSSQLQVRMIITPLACIAGGRLG